jgi:LL-diaminopimelate aminotransferase
VIGCLPNRIGQKAFPGVNYINDFGLSIKETMITSQISLLPAERIASFKPYFFASLNQRITELRAQGKDIIRLDMGSPDLPPANFIIDTLVESARRTDSHGYTPIGGSPAYRNAITTYYQQRFLVDLDPQTEVLGLIGSKEGLFDLSQVILNQGDIALVPDPGYPVYSAGARIAGGDVYPMPLCAEKGFLPDLESIPENVLKRAKLLWLNYPNNPTGAIAPLKFFEQVVAFAHDHQILIAHDAPYVDVCFDGYHAPSLMQIPGAKEVAVEFNSLSKAYNMGGWRLGMVVGHTDVIRFLNTYKSQVDSSTFFPLMEAGVQAMTGDQDWINARNGIYQERRDIVLKGIREGGLEAQTPPATIYVWARLPKGENSIDFCNRLLVDTGVSTTPGVVYGQSGEGYLRVSLGIATEQVRIAMQRFVDWAKKRSRGNR